MKITQLRGDLAAFRNLELSIVLNAMKTENSRKPVTTLRQNIPYLTPGIKSLAAEKIPVVLFGVTLKREDERIGVVTYTGLVLLSIGNLIGRAEAAAIRDRAAGFPQTLASDRVEGVSKSWSPLPCPTVPCRRRRSVCAFSMPMPTYVPAAIMRHSSNCPSDGKKKAFRFRNKDAVCRMIRSCIIIRMLCRSARNNLCRCPLR